MRDPRYRLLVVLGVVLAILDQAAKWSVVWFFENIEGSRKVMVKGTFDLILTRNPGAAWSMLGDLKPDWLRVSLFIVLSLLAIAFIFYYASKAKPEQRLFLWGLGFVLGGAVGNLIDRIMAGAVVDYLEFYSRAPWMVDLLGCSKGWGCRFPAFNVADIAINVGVGLLILDAIVTTFRKEPAVVADEPLPIGAFPPVDPAAPPVAAPSADAPADAPALPPPSTEPV